MSIQSISTGIMYKATFLAFPTVVPSIFQSSVVAASSPRDGKGSLLHHNFLESKDGRELYRLCYPSVLLNIVNYLT